MADVIRRDPRIERIARNRLHPQHAAVTAVGDVRGPTGLLRKNPHAVGFIGPNGIKRIDRSTKGSANVLMRRTGQQAATQTLELPLHTVETPDYLIAVVVDLAAGRLSGHDKDVLGQAHQLMAELDGQGAILAIAFGESRDVDFGAAGADRVLHLSDYTGYCPEQKLAVLEAIEAEHVIRFWLFPDSVQGGADLGRRLSARLDIRAATHAWQVDANTTLCRGGRDRIDWQRSTPRLILLAEECAMPISDSRHEARPIAVPVIESRLTLIEDLGPVDVDPSQIALGEAEFIVSAGNGVRDWDQFHEVARALGATEGASRVAVDDGNMPRFRQVGATGTWVTARVYIAVGISGAIQHLQGIGQCDKVIAINMDPGCDMVKRADLSVIGDSQAILAELLNLLGADEQASLAATEARHVA
ncbi:electron transfer flavoprotein subunit alpha [Saccharospirillum sp. MSK14-1]|uniref:electron transfer flavoprotein subunit alpha n=1 Tax=Saccharospirillum sp. MSK14-1 TaxID=1897632 RepID=UPI000D39718D|nr:electron transfer flavoprotein subunit alpha/FixB family protein [Saccharospirillum sp. MSK14-1]PTY38193.1 electron transfer flavoprotein subunit alpha [Saccharospirillum sp. MSK14-1]